MTTNGTGDGGIDGGDELFRELVKEHGQQGAAARLGVSHNTVRRSLKAGRPSHLLRGKLEAYLLRRGREEKRLEVAGDADQPQAERSAAAVGEVNKSHDGNGIAVPGETGRDLNHRQHETDLSELPLKKLVAFLAITVGQLQRYLTSAQSDGTTRDADGSTGPDLESDRAAAPGESSAPGDFAAEGGSLATKETPGGGRNAAVPTNDSTPEESRATTAETDELLKKWWQARVLESAAKTELEKSIARERTLQIEMAIVWENDKTIPIEETWNAIKREREWERRLRALSAVSRERRRLTRRRRLRRILTLGLWRW